MVYLVLTFKYWNINRFAYCRGDFYMKKEFKLSEEIIDDCDLCFPVLDVDKVKELVKTNLKKYLGIEEKPAAAAPSAEVPGAEKKLRPNVPGATNEGVRKAVRDIISENLKHF